ncbi:MAG TPA: hypothetical protein VNL94_03360 [Candidatus Binatia bacterium]|nr:hypothetical protein [Candidatus Binatia bacterium]
MTAEAGAGRREPLLLGIIGALIGIIVAMVIFGGGLGGGGLAGASVTPTAAGPSTEPSATLTAETSVPSAEATPAPSTDAPTQPPTAAPTATPAPTPAKTPKPTPTVNANPTIVSFEAPQQEDCTNATAGSVHLKWTIRNATGVTISIDGPGIFMEYPGLTNEVDLPYGCDFVNLQHTYTLRTVGGTDPAASITRTIKTRAPSITSFTVTKPDCPTDSGTVSVTMTYEIRAATGAELRIDGVLWATYNGKQVSVPVGYDCTQNDQEFVLTTTGGYGPAATTSIKKSKN